MKNDSKIPNSKRILNPLIDSENSSPSLKKSKIHHEKSDIVENTSSFAMKSKSNNENKNTALTLSLPQSSSSQAKVSILNQNAHSAYSSDKDMGIGIPMALNADLESIKNKLNIEGITNDISRYMRSMSREDHLNNNNLKILKKLNNLLLIRKTMQHLIGVMSDNIRGFKDVFAAKHELDRVIEIEKKFFYKGIKDRIQQVYTSLEDPDEILGDVLKPLPEWMQSEFQEFSSEIKKSYRSGPSGVVHYHDDTMVEPKSEPIIDTAMETAVDPKTDTEVDISKDAEMSSALGTRYPSVPKGYHDPDKIRKKYYDLKLYLFHEHPFPVKALLFEVLNHAYSWLDTLLEPSDLLFIDFKSFITEKLEKVFASHENPEFIFNEILNYLPSELKKGFKEALYDVSKKFGKELYNLEVKNQPVPSESSTALMVDTATAHRNSSAYQEFKSLNDSMASYTELRPYLFDHHSSESKEKVLMLMDRVYSLVDFFLEPFSQEQLSTHIGTKILTTSQIQMFKLAIKGAVRKICELYLEPEIFFDDISINIPLEFRDAFQEVIQDIANEGGKPLDNDDLDLSMHRQLAYGAGSIRTLTGNRPMDITGNSWIIGPDPTNNRNTRRIHGGDVNTGNRNETTAPGPTHNLNIQGIHGGDVNTGNRNETIAPDPIGNINAREIHIGDSLDITYAFSENLHKFKTVVDNYINDIKIKGADSDTLEFFNVLDLIINGNILHVEQNLQDYFADDSASNNDFLYNVDLKTDIFLKDIIFSIEEFLRRDSKKDFIRKFIDEIPEAFKRELKNSLDEVLR
jgi:hypothetical protein